MSTHRLIVTALESLVGTLIVLVLLNVSLAQVRTSSSYQLQSDSINIGGGFSSSTNYSQESTVGEVATGESGSSGYSLYAGYQQMQEVFLSLSVSDSVVSMGNIYGLSGGTVNGSTTITVITDSPSGYTMTIAAENNPAMQSLTSSITDYNAGIDPDFSFSLNPGDAHLAYTPEGVDIVSRFKDNGIDTCNSGTDDTALACWDGLSTTDAEFARSSSPNQPDGATTTLNFRVGIGSSAGVEAGLYTATTTVTALPL